MAGRHWINLWSSSDVLSGIGGLSNLKGDSADGSTAKYRWHWTRRIAVWFSLSLLVPSSAVAFHSVISADYSSALSYVGSVSAAATVQMLVILVFIATVDIFVVPLSLWIPPLSNLVAVVFFSLLVVALSTLLLAVVIGHAPQSAADLTGFWLLLAVCLCGHAASLIMGRAKTEAYPNEQFSHLFIIDDLGRIEVDLLLFAQLAEWQKKNSHHDLVVESYVVPLTRSPKDFIDALTRARKLKNVLANAGCDQKRIAILVGRPFRQDLEPEMKKARVIRLFGILVADDAKDTEEAERLIVTVHGLLPQHYRYWAFFRTYIFGLERGTTMIAYKWDDHSRGWTTVLFGAPLAQLATYMFWRCFVIHELRDLLKLMESEEHLILIGHSLGALIAYEAWADTEINAQLVTINLGFSTRYYRCI